MAPMEPRTLAAGIVSSIRPPVLVGSPRLVKGVLRATSIRVWARLTAVVSRLEKALLRAAVPNMANTASISKPIRAEAIITSTSVKPS